MNEDIYEYKGKHYRLIKRVLIKIPQSFWDAVMTFLSPSSQMSVTERFTDYGSGKKGWVPGVLYLSIDGGYYYTRESKDFFNKFKKWEDPDQSKLELEE